MCLCVCVVMCLCVYVVMCLCMHLLYHTLDKRAINPNDKNNKNNKSDKSDKSVVDPWTPSLAEPSSRVASLIHALLARYATRASVAVVHKRGLTHAVTEGATASERPTPFARMQACRDALSKLDGLGWRRSFHQRLFHEDFLVSLLRYVFCVFAVKSKIRV